MMVRRLQYLILLGLMTCLAPSPIFATEQGRGWGSSWTVPHSQQERAMRSISDRLDKALRANDWAAVARVLEDAERANPKSWELQDAKGLVAMLRRRYSEAAECYGRALALLPGGSAASTASRLYVKRSSAYALAGQYRAARSDLERAIAIDKNNLSAHNGYAWLLATCPDASVRDGKRALEFARAANQRTGNKEAMILDTLAAAQAEAGDFRAAVSTQKRALALTKRDRPVYERHLQSFLSSTPVREAPEPPELPPSRKS